MFLKVYFWSAYLVLKYSFNLEGQKTWARSSTQAFIFQGIYPEGMGRTLFQVRLAKRFTQGA